MSAKTAKASPKTLRVREEQRTLAAVSTVLPTSSGAASCTTKRDVFDVADSGRAPLEIRIEAATTCASCPLRQGCGFRVAMPRTDSRARARNRARNRNRTT